MNAPRDDAREFKAACERAGDAALLFQVAHIVVRSSHGYQVLSTKSLQADMYEALYRAEPRDAPMDKL